MSLALPKFSAFSRTTAGSGRPARPAARGRGGSGSPRWSGWWSGWAWRWPWPRTILSDPAFTTSGDGWLRCSTCLATPRRLALRRRLLLLLGYVRVWWAAAGRRTCCRPCATLARRARARWRCLSDGRRPRRRSWPKSGCFCDSGWCCCSRRQHGTGVDTALSPTRRASPGGHSGGVRWAISSAPPVRCPTSASLGSGVLWIALLVLGMAGALRFSWMQPGRRASARLDRIGVRAGALGRWRASARRTNASARSHCANASSRSTRWRIEDVHAPHPDRDRAAEIVAGGQESTASCSASARSRCSWN